ncbi:MAG: hypothetical protein ABSB52_09600 [Acidimicrobiales bacterium]
MAGTGTDQELKSLPGPLDEHGLVVSRATIAQWVAWIASIVARGSTRALYRVTVSGHDERQPLLTHHFL